MKRPPTATLVLLLFAAVLTGCVTLGADATGERAERIESSPNWEDGQFVNTLPDDFGDFGDALSQSLSGANAFQSPAVGIPVVYRERASFERESETGLRVTWMGHSTVLLEIDGHRILFDPVWSERASPVTWAGPKRFHPMPIALTNLPRIDAVAISHDHYDHLDYATIRGLNEQNVQFFVPLGIGADLEHWGVPAERITELDWWQSGKVGDLELVSTPSRHSSGRTIGDQRETLWTSWAVIGPQHRAYFSGDTAMFPGFAEIGQKYGPFDIAMIESGAYNRAWANFHLGPEQAVQAAQMVQARVMLPIHWSTFDLGLHNWTEPMERVWVAAETAGQRVISPRPGESVEPAVPRRWARWWPALPYQTAEEHPVVSSGMEEHDHVTIGEVQSPPSAGSDRE